MSSYLFSSLAATVSKNAILVKKIRSDKLAVTYEKVYNKVVEKIVDYSRNSEILELKLNVTNLVNDKILAEFCDTEYVPTLTDSEYVEMCDYVVKKLTEAKFVQCRSDIAYQDNTSIYFVYASWKIV